MCLLACTGPEWCPNEVAAPCSNDEIWSDEKSGVVEVGDSAMSGLGPGLNLVNL